MKHCENTDDGLGDKGDETGAGKIFDSDCN